MKKRLIYLFLCLTIMASLFSGCFKEKEETKEKDGLLTVDVFSDKANYQGIQSGWFGKIVKEKFNLELNIIAPNISGGGDTLFQTRSAAGDLGDLIILDTKEGKLKNSVEAQLLLDISDLLKDKDVFKNYEDAINAVTELSGTDGVWGIPEDISSQSADTPSEGNELTFGPYLRWDLYKEIGYPEIGTLEELLPILEKMQNITDKAENGKDIYAISLFKDWDDNMMNNAKQPTCFYGYDEMGFVLANADGTDFQSIIESDSEYTRVLKFFYEANQMGLVDPDSTTQNFDTLSTKYVDGQVLYSPWPWLGQSQYNTPEKKEEGKGFMLAPIDDLKIFSYGCTPLGNTKHVIGIGSQAEQPERLAEFIDWIYSSEGQEINAQGNGACGPEGLTWEKKDGKAVLTEYGKKALYNPDEDVPKDWGGGVFSKGISALNFKALNNTDIDPNTNEAYDYKLWESVLADNTTPLQEDWTKHMDGAKTTKEYLEKNDMITVAPGTGYVQPAEDSEISTIRNQCKDLIINYSWQMIFAKNDSEFNSLLKDMQEQVEGLGYKDVLKVDMANAKEQDELRKAAAK